jgi:FtsZ-binding cell division protein ZapB
VTQGELLHLGEQALSLLLYIFWKAERMTVPTYITVLQCYHPTTNLGCSAQREIEEFRHHVHTLQQEQQKLEQTIARLQQDILELKREVKERDGTIQGKVGARMFLSFIGCRIILDLKNTDRTTP